MSGSAFIKRAKPGDQITAKMWNELVDHINRMSRFSVTPPLRMVDVVAGTCLFIDRGALPRIVRGVLVTTFGRGETSTINVIEKKTMTTTGETHGIVDRGMIPADTEVLNGTQVYVWTEEADEDGNWLYLTHDCNQEDIG